MHVPIKTAIQHFTVHRIVALPVEMGNDKFVKYQFDYDYFALGNNQRDYALLGAADFEQCTATDVVTVCPVNIAFLDANVKTCVQPVFSGTGRKCTMQENSFVEL
jgi:hypothetical protein